MKSENEYSITSKDDMIDTESYIDSDMDTDDDGDEYGMETSKYIPLYDNKNDYNPNFICSYVNIRLDRTAIDYIHLSLHSGGFYKYLQTQAYEHELHIAQTHQSNSVTLEDKRLESIHALYSDAKDFYLERHGHRTYTSSRNRDINNISEEEMHTCQNCVKGQYVRYQDERISTLSDKIDASEECWGQSDEVYADRAYRQYLFIRAMNAAGGKTDGAYACCAYINYLTNLIELPKQKEFDTQIMRGPLGRHGQRHGVRRRHWTRRKY